MPIILVDEIRDGAVVCMGSLADFASQRNFTVMRGRYLAGGVVLEIRALSSNCRTVTWLLLVVLIGAKDP